MSTGNLNIHFNAPSVRRDTWGRLRSTVQRLQRVYEKSSDVEEIRAEMHKQLGGASKTLNFKTEYRLFLERHEIPYDERFVWD